MVSSATITGFVSERRLIGAAFVADHRGIVERRRANFGTNGWTCFDMRRPCDSLVPSASFMRTAATATVTLCERVSARETQDSQG
jgi:hypothetical protein